MPQPYRTRSLPVGLLGIGLGTLPLVVADPLTEVRLRPNQSLCRFGFEHATEGVMLISSHAPADLIHDFFYHLNYAFMLIKTIANGAGGLPRPSLPAPPDAPHPTQPMANRCPMQAAWMSSGLGAEPAAMGEALAVLLDERRPPAWVNGLELNGGWGWERLSCRGCPA
jgi:hypothetical protein